MKYNKPPLKAAEHIDLLKNRGLIIPDESRVIKYFDNVGYFRLTGYMFHLQSNDGSHNFIEGTTFCQVISHYQFDKKLRLMILNYIERIEVALRSHLSDKFSRTHDFFWYTKEELYKNKKTYKELTDTIREAFQNPSERFLKSFKSKYDEETFPPSNMAIEMLSFGLLSRLFAGLDNNKEKQQVADDFDMASTVLATWFQHLTTVRNICAHHGRLWNRSITAYMPRIPNRSRYKFYGELPRNFNTSFYGVMAIIIRLLNAFNPTHSFVYSFTELIKLYPEIDVSKMGMPTNWQDEPAWKIC